MSKVGEILANIALGTASEAVNAVIGDLLNNVKENNTNDPQLIVDAVKGVDSALKLLARAATKSKTKIDDKAIAMLHKPFVEFAVENGINLDE